MPLKYLSRASLIRCCHGGTVKPKEARHKLRINGEAVLTDKDLLGADVLACPQTGPGIVPCTKVLRIVSGSIVKGVAVSKSRPLLESFSGVTNSNPPGLCTVVNDGGSVVRTRLAGTGASPGAARQKVPEQQGTRQREDDPNSLIVSLRLDLSNIANDVTLLRERLSVKGIWITATVVQHLLATGKYHAERKVVVLSTEGGTSRVLFSRPFTAHEPAWLLVTSHPGISSISELAPDTFELGTLCHCRMKALKLIGPLPPAVG